MLTSDKIRRVALLARELQYETDFDVFIEKALTTLESLFHASSSVILDWTPFVWGERSLSKEDMFFHNFGSGTEWDYPKVHHEDPIYEWIESGRCHNDLNVARLSDLANYRDIRKTSFYSQLLEPMNCRYVMTMALHRRADILASLSVTRTPEQRNFTRADISLAQLINPILANTFNHLALKRKASLTDDVFDVVSGKIEHQAVIVFSADLESIYRTDKMTNLGERLSRYGDSIRDIFDKSPIIRKYLNRFLSSNPSDHLRLPREISDCVQVDSGWSVNITLQSSTYSAERRYLMATFTVDESTSQLNSLQVEYGLTMREYQVFQLAARGLSSRKMGEELAISFWSVKNHLKNIYKKTGADNRAKLAQLQNR